jgi:hypothetical protein
MYGLKLAAAGQPVPSHISHESVCCCAKFTLDVSPTRAEVIPMARCAGFAEQETGGFSRQVVTPRNPGLKSETWATHWNRQATGMVAIRGAEGNGRANRLRIFWGYPYKFAGVCFQGMT